MTEMMFLMDMIKLNMKIAIEKEKFLKKNDKNLLEYYILNTN
jgi:hypothetical protein